MKTSYIRSLIQLVEESEIESLEVSSWGHKLSIVRKVNPGVVAPATVVQAAAPTPLAPASAPTPAPALAAEDTSGLVAIKSPMVGTYYAAPAPDADSYVSLNQKIRVGQVVCIVEAMKLMNEIESEVSGRVSKVLVENAQPVEFGQELFLIESE